MQYNCSTNHVYPCVAWELLSGRKKLLAEAEKHIISMCAYGIPWWQILPLVGKELIVSYFLFLAGTTNWMSWVKGKILWRQSRKGGRMMKHAPQLSQIAHCHPVWVPKVLWMYLCNIYVCTFEMQVPGFSQAMRTRLSVYLHFRIHYTPSFTSCSVCVYFVCALLRRLRLVHWCNHFPLNSNPVPIFHCAVVSIHRVQAMLT